MRFKNNVVLITWASRWIWRATALYFWKEWARVVVNYLKSQEKAEQVVAMIKKLWGSAFAFKWDISSEEQVQNLINKTIKEFWKIDILINNAAVSSDIPLLHRTSKDWENTLGVNLIGMFLCSKYVIKEMLKRKGGKIINLSSINGTKYFFPEQIDYDVSKAWVITLTKELAKEFWPSISVNAVAPWNIDNYDESEVSWDPTDDEIENIYLKEYWKITEVAKTILFLAGNESNYINGTTIFIDWGCD